ncbi:MMPL family transporter [Allosalinactinospora lopnorensis]|uniref:MMPL family transporter n=1 Tax=Allosalinactinospora lopnorensis TaxID=1352348 RepID=UPI000623F609|nr:MMPL family transporter [Allosalinactinospora lopnorensis]
MSTLLERLGRFAARRPLLLLLCWMLVAGIVIGAAQHLGPKYGDGFDLPGTESQAAQDLLEEEFPEARGANLIVVLSADDVPIAEKDGSEAEIAAAFERVASMEEIAEAPNPLALPPEAGVVSADGRTAYSPVRANQAMGEIDDPDALTGAIDDRFAPVRAAGVDVDFTGQMSSTYGTAGFSGSELVGLGVAAIVLIVAFGSVVAAGLPLVTAIAGLTACLSATWLLGRVWQIPEDSMLIAAMIGLGVGIDYALLIVSRYREYLLAGESVESALGTSLASTGRSVVFAGGTVIVAILGLWLTGLPVAGGMGTATAVTVTGVSLTSLTLLPALLGLTGRHITRLRLGAVLGRGRGRRVDARDGFWTRVAQAATARPLVSALAAVLFLGVLTIPVFSLRLGLPDDGSRPPESTQRQAYDQLAEEFGPGTAGPFTVVVRMAEGTGEEDLAGLTGALGEVPGVERVTPPTVNEEGSAAVLSVVPATSPQSSATVELLHELRDDVVPEARGGSTAVVGGPTAYYADMGELLQGRLALFIGGVVLVSFVLLMFVFRSILVPLKAAMANLLSIGAAYGVVVAVFQWGWGKELIGLPETIPIEPFVPLLMFAMLFGVSMDYEVFLVSRIREEYDLSGDAVAATIRGVAGTGSVITSAALIMIAVFLSFVGQSEPFVKLFGLGMAVAILLDATVVRMLLVPAVMRLMGPAAWWLPGFLRRGKTGEPRTDREPVPTAHT